MITARQREERKTCLGGSDIARCLSGEFGGAACVQQAKLYDIEEVSNPAIEMGNDLEPALLAFAKEELGPIRKNVERRVPGSRIKVHLDAVVTETGRIVEAKTAGLFWTPAARQYGEPGTSDVPDYVWFQVHAGFCATTADACHVAVWHPHRGKVMYEVPAVRELCEQILEFAAHWWQRHIINREPVELEQSAASYMLETIRRTKRETGKRIQIAVPDNVDRWQEMRDARLVAQQAEDHFKALVLRELGDAEIGALPDGRTVEYRSTAVKRLNMKALRREEPKVAARFMEESTCRKAVVKEPDRESAYDARE